MSCHNRGCVLRHKFQKLDGTINGGYPSNRTMFVNANESRKIDPMMQSQPRFRRSHLPIYVVYGVLLALVAACTPLIRQPDAQSAAENAAVANVRQVLMQQLHTDAAAIEVVEAVAEVWTDACLGAGRANESCLQAQTPGYQITLAVNGDEYRYHTNEDGSNFRLVAAPAPTISEPILTWTGSDEQGCQTVAAGLEGVVFGPCFGTLLEAPYSFDTRQSDLATFADEYQSFTAETPAGSVDFVGNGKRAATPAEQRMIAEWGRLVALEAQGGRSGASWGLILAWHREGGFAGFCDDVTVYVTGDAYVTSCKGNQPQEVGRVRLSPDQLALVYGWIDTLQSFEVEQSDPATADAMTIRMVFSGAGTATVPEATQQTITDLALTLINQVAAPRLSPDATAAAIDPATRCLPAAADQQSLVDTVNGYCLLYPTDYVAVESEAVTVNLVKGDIMNHTDPRVAITVEDVAGRTLEEVVAELETVYGLPDTPVERGSITVDGVDAVVLDNLPGQDLNRRVVLMHNDRLYSFFFTPLGEPGQARADMELFYQGIFDSLRFLTETPPTPLPLPEASAVITSEVALIQALVNVNIRSGPGTNYGIVGKVFAGQLAQVTGVMPDNSWWQVICPDGTVGSCFVVNDPSFVQPASTPDESTTNAPPPTPITEPITDTGEAIIESVEVRIVEETPVRIEAVIRGQLPDACSFIQDTGVAVVGTVFNIRLTTARQLNQRCIQILTPFEQVVRLGSPEPAIGDYEVHVGAVVERFTLGE